MITDDEEGNEGINRFFDSIQFILIQYDVLNQVVIHLTVNIVVVIQLTNIQDVGNIPIPGPDNDGTLDDIWYGIVGKILFYLIPQGHQHLLS